MLKNFFCVSLKTGSLILAVFNFVSGIGGIIVWCIKLQRSDNADDTLFHVIALCLAMSNAVRGAVLIIGIVKGSHFLVLVWLIVAFTDLSVMLVFTGVHMFEYKLYVVGFTFSVIFWYCWFCVLNFYQELRVYNLGQKAVAEDPRLITVPSSTEYTEQVLC